MTDEGTGSVSFTTKEMLVRMDGKLDSVLGRQAHYDVELALLKARTEELARTMTDHQNSGGSEAAKLADELEASREKMDAAVETIQQKQNKTDRKLAYATGTVSAIIVLGEAISRFWPK